MISPFLRFCLKPNCAIGNPCYELPMESISSFTERIELLYKKFYTIGKPQFKIPNEGLLVAENTKPSELCTTWQSKHAYLDTLNRDGPLISAVWISYRKAPINWRGTHLFIKTHKKEACGSVSSPDEVSHVIICCRKRMIFRDSHKLLTFPKKMDL